MFRRLISIVLVSAQSWAFCGLAAAASLVAPPTNAVHADELATYETLLTKQALDADTNFGGSPCSNALVEHVSTDAVKIEDHPDLPVLLERLKVTGCGRTSVQNIHVGRFGGSPPWQMVEALPGESLADMNLQGSTFPAAVAQARVELPANCKGQQLADIYVGAWPGHVNAVPPGSQVPVASPGSIGVQLPASFEAQRNNLNLSAAWMEVWPIKLCGKNRTTGIVFIPLRDQVASLYMFLPIWRQMRDHGDGAKPALAPRPPEDGYSAYQRGDYATAVQLWRAEVEAGDSNVQYDLGLAYLNGKGVAQDDTQAAEWFQKAADQGHPGAQFSLGEQYADGDGVPQNNTQAYLWYSLAAATLDERNVAANDNTAAQYRDALAAKMTPDQIAEGKRLVREWHATSEPVRPTPAAAPTL
jgi:hypothetical protein